MNENVLSKPTDGASADSGYTAKQRVMYIYTHGLMWRAERISKQIKNAPRE